MKNNATVPALLMAAGATTLSGCAAIEGIFKAGLWTGIIAVVFVAMLIGGGIALFSRAGR